MARPHPSGMRTASVAGRLAAATDAAFASPLEAIGSAIAAGAGSASAAAGGMLLLRRFAGGFATTDGGLAWLVTAFGIAVVAVADAAAGRSGAFGPLAARVGLAAAVVAVAIPPRPGDLATIAAVMVSAAVALYRQPLSNGSRRAAILPRAGRTADATSPRRSSPARRSDVPGRLVQRLERYETADGHDCLRGRVCLSVAAGSRGTHAHVGFCPAFAATPTVQVHTDYDGVEAVVTAAEVLPWGVRVECRLSEPADEPLEIPVDVSVRTAP